MTHTIATPITDAIREQDPELAISVIAAAQAGQVTPWAVLLVCFSDDPEELPDRALYERLYTTKGIGTMNMVDFFSDMSHGTVSIVGSQVFGWYRLAARRASYVGNATPKAGELDRDGLLNLAWATAAAATGDLRVDFADFAGTVVVPYGPTELCGFLGGMAAICGSTAIQPSLIGQEMGHGYGLDHARRDGSEDDYMDPWDVMSTAAWPDHQADSPHWGRQSVGPGLNAWSMRSRGWLDESRVWKLSGTAAFTTTIELRPLHRHDLPGLLAAEVGEYLVEFRMPELWDAAIPRACVLVHRFEDNHPYVMTAVRGTLDLVEGDSFVDGHPEFVLGPYSSVEVKSIDEHERKATIAISHRPRFKEPALTGTTIGAVEVDGPGYLILRGGRVIPIPPRGPVQELVDRLASYLSLVEAGEGLDVAATTAARRAALRGLIGTAARLHAQAEPVSEPPPGFTAGIEPSG